jgi:hypothetical protein
MMGRCMCFVVACALFGYATGKLGAAGANNPYPKVGCHTTPTRATAVLRLYAPGAAPRTHARTHAPTHPRTHARTHARMLLRTLLRTHPPTHPHPYARPYARTHARTHPRTCLPSKRDATHARTHGDVEGLYMAGWASGLGL